MQKNPIKANDRNDNTEDKKEGQKRHSYQENEKKERANPFGVGNYFT